MKSSVQGEHASILSDKTASHCTTVG